jgi:hypothetical protein
MFCAISGVTPEVPVVSAKSGLLYEKRLALKLVSEAAQEPGQQVGESLTLEERCWAGVLGCTSAGRPTSPHCSLPWMKPRTSAGRSGSQWGRRSGRVTLARVWL